MQTGADPILWVIDRQDRWRNLAVRALEQAGFRVSAYGCYEEPLAVASSNDSRPDLVLLGCAASTSHEQALLKALVQRGWPVVIFASLLSSSNLRGLFHAGATDVVSRPDTEDRLLSIVNADLAALARNRMGSPRRFLVAP